MRIILAMLLVLGAQTPAATNDNGTVAGVVLRYGTGQPISETQVILTADTVANAVGSTTTDVSGRFSFSARPPDDMPWLRVATITSHPAVWDVPKQL
jgi:hypothetical protein